MIGFNVFNRRIVLYCRRVERVAGLNSTLKDGKHIGMVDIDRDSLENVIKETEHVMSKYRVGRADIMSTGKPGGYHVYLWGRLSFKESLQAMLEFTRVDLQHVRWTIKRGHATLRLSAKSGRKITKVETLHNDAYEETFMHDLKSWVKYQTGGLDDTRSR